MNVLYVATLAMKLEREAPKRQDRIPSIVNIQGEGVLFSLSTYPSSDPPCSTAGQGEVRIIARSNHSLYRGPSDVILEQIIINYYYLIAMITTQNPKRMISK